MEFKILGIGCLMKYGLRFRQFRMMNREFLDGDSGLNIYRNTIYRMRYRNDMIYFQVSESKRSMIICYSNGTRNNCWLTCFYSDGK